MHAFARVIHSTCCMHFFLQDLWLETPVATTSGSQNHEMQYHVYLVSLFKLVLKCADGKSALKKIIKVRKLKILLK